MPTFKDRMNDSHILNIMNHRAMNSNFPIYKLYITSTFGSISANKDIFNNNHYQGSQLDAHKRSMFTVQRHPLGQGLIPLLSQPQ